MASFPDLFNYYMHQSFSSILEIENFQMNPMPPLRPNGKNDAPLPCTSSTLTSEDSSVELLTRLHFKIFFGEVKGAYLDVHLHKSPPKALLMLAISLLDADGEKHITQYSAMMSTQLDRGNEPICAKICSGKKLQTLPYTLRYLETLKVLVEVFAWKKGAPLTPLTSDYASLLETGALSDVTLVVGQREFPVHKLILSVRSPVFARMLTSNFKESKENRVVIEDMSEEVLQELLSFLYTERVQNLAENAAELLMAAEKYQIESLKWFCGQNLARTLDTDNFLQLLQLAYLYKVTQLKIKCLKFFELNSRKIQMTQSWKELITVKSPLNQEILRDCVISEEFEMHSQEL